MAAKKPAKKAAPKKGKPPGGGSNVNAVNKKRTFTADKARRLPPARFG